MVKLCSRTVLHAGEREPVYKASKDLVYEVHTLAVEERPDDDVILRRVMRSDNLSNIRAATLQLANNAEEASSLLADAASKAEEDVSPEHLEPQCIRV